MRINTSQPNSAPQPPLEYINIAKEIEHVLNYEKDMTYYLTVTYDMTRLYTVYLLIYLFVFLKCSWAFVIFASFMCCSILYIIDRAIIVSIKQYFARATSDAYQLHMPAAEAGTSAPTRVTTQQPHYNYKYTILQPEGTNTSARLKTDSEPIYFNL
jgi:hypothetical protein